MDTEPLKSDLERVTGARVSDSDGSMAEALARLDACASAAATPDVLKHYLSRRSYVKALAWLEDPSLRHER
jgi:hypothetical protein